MENRKYKKLVGAVLATGAAFLINLLIQLLLTPYITETVGTEAYGFVALAKNFAQYAMIATMALTSFAARYVAVSYHAGNNHEANVLFSSAFFGVAALATGLLAAAVAVIVVLERVLQIPPELLSDVKLLFLLVFLNFWLVNLFSVFESTGYIKNKLYLTGAFKCLSYLAEAAVLFVLYFLFPARVFYVGFGLLAASAVVAAGNLWITRRYTPELRVRRREFSLQAVKDLLGNGIWTSVNSLGEVLNSGLDLVVCDLMLSPLQMGQVAIAKTVHTMFQGVFVILNPAFQPMLLKSYAENDKKTLLDELRLAMKVSGMAANILFAGFAALGLGFYCLWLPGEDTGFIYKLTVINLLTMIPAGPMQPLYYIYTLTLKKMIPSLVTILGGVCNVIGMILLIQNTSMGATAVVWTTAIVTMAINFISNPLYMAYVLEIPMYSFYPAILRNVISCGVLTAVFYGLTRLYTPHSWAALVVCALLMAALGIVLHLAVVCNRTDWKRIVRYIRRRG